MSISVVVPVERADLFTAGLNDSVRSTRILTVDNRPARAEAEFNKQLSNRRNDESIPEPGYGLSIGTLLALDPVAERHSTNEPLQEHSAVSSKVTASPRVVLRVGGGTLNPDAGELALTAGWGHAGKGGITMPGKGRLNERAHTPAELEAIAAGVEALGLSTGQALAHLGETTFDVYLNDVVCWRNISARVWDYTIGGYQVIKKWLSYRERA